MLLELSIHNLVIVERAELRPGQGLTAITGETGAGKSLLLDAIDLISGARIRPGLVGRWGEAATVNAVFQVDAQRGLRIRELVEPGGEPAAEPLTQVIVRRRISEQGRSQAWIDGIPVTVAVLKTVADLLIDLHAQHEPIRLADPAVQLDLIDGFGEHREVAASYAKTYADLLRLRTELARLDGGERESLKEIDYLKFQLAAIEAVAPKAGDYAALEQRHELLSQASTWRDHASDAAQRLTESDDAVTQVLARCIRRLEGAPDSRLAQAVTEMKSALEAIRDAGARCQDAADSIDADPAQAQQVAERLDQWNDLLRRHGPDEASLLAAWEALAKRLDELSGLVDRRSGVARDLASTQQLVQRLGHELATARAKVFVRLAEGVHGHLAELGMPKAQIVFADAAIDGGPTPLGIRRQEIQVITNPGQPPGSIREVASGGEAARLMLAISATLAAADAIPLMVFDEVDSGVGGRLGVVIGAKLAILALHRSVLAVTHTPHVAAYATRHYVVTKRQGSDQTTVTVSELAETQRSQELAEMLGGGAAAATQAGELLAQARSAHSSHAAVSVRIGRKLGKER